MRISCVICGDLCVQSDDISAAPCGHTFHSVCLIQWIERSKSCPQCRHRATEKNILKLFFDAGGSDDNEVDPDTLQHQIDNLKFQTRLRDQEISNMKDENKTLSTHNKGLREECKSLEKSLKDKETTNVALKSQLKFMEQMKSEAQKARENAKALRNQLSLLQNVETVLSGTADDVESVLRTYSNDNESITAMATFSCILKKELQKAIDDKKRYRDQTSALRAQVKEFRNNFNSASAQLNSTEQSKKLLEADVLSLEKENASLRKKVDALQSAIVSPSGDVKNSALHRLIAESPAPSNLKRPNTSDEEVMVVTPEVVRKLARLEAEDDVECLGSYSQGASQVSSSPQKKLVFLHGRKPLTVKTNVSQSSGNRHHNIFAKNKPSLLNVDINQLPNRSSQGDSDQIGYDGLGGHHKVDEFPKPKPVSFKKKTSLKVVSKSGSRVQKTTIKNFFQNTFDDDM